MLASCASWLMAIAAAMFIEWFNPLASPPVAPFVQTSAQLLINAIFTGFVQLVGVGIAANLLVRVYVRAHHPFLAALASNGAAIATVVLGGWLFMPQVAAAAVLVAATIYLRASLIDLHRQDSSHLCRTCFYDLRGLPEPVCPECGTAITSP